MESSESRVEYTVFPVEVLVNVYYDSLHFIHIRMYIKVDFMF